MFKKIHSIFHPNSHRRNVTDDIPYCDGTGSAVRLIRSTSMYILGGEQEKVSEPLKKYRSTTSIDSCFQTKEEDRDWMYSKTQDCLKYLQDLLALRKKYLDNINKLKSIHMAADSPMSTKSSKTGKKSFFPLPSEESSKASIERKGPQSGSDLLPAQANTVYIQIGSFVLPGDTHKILPKQQKLQTSLKETASGEPLALGRGWKDTPCTCPKLWKAHIAL
ncbi:uncharacterized protein C13orf42 homolog isoform X2 [Athene cunicularia]|uniref:uncharacterized protein C13orf42 homolog isoform X2 n=1 Tax=Athene cunicularia TaxID=194338 RepID=UPI000EF66BBD|nr:uncharacterized protein C13orf42 homolog isoform X2 [Athene cunicularia]